MKVTFKTEKTPPPVYTPKSITITFETLDEEVGFKHLLGCCSLQVIDSVFEYVV